LVEIIKQFGEFIKALDIAAILPLSTGLSAIALILAALLILIALFRRKTAAGNFILVIFFGVLAGVFVCVDTFARPPSAASIIHMMSVGIPKDEEAFPIHVRINSDPEWDLVATPTDRTIKDTQTFIYVNANEVAYRLATRARQVSELTKKVEEVEREIHRVPSITEGGN
jgi:hypothetical protein